MHPSGTGLQPGSRLGAYEIVGLLGAGGMGEVYRARDTKLDRGVALKILPESFASDPDRLMRFEREAKTLAQLNHPNIRVIIQVIPVISKHHFCQLSYRSKDKHGRRSISSCSSLRWQNTVLWASFGKA